MAGQSFQPDLVWIKIRSGAGSNVLTDSVRGVNSQLFSNQTAAQETNTDHVTALNSNGFSLGTGTSGTYPSTNNNGSTYVAWQWKAGGAAVTNTAGSISSQVSANTTSGFSIVTYTGTGANATVGHGLGVAPKMVIHKIRNGVGNWPVFHINTDAGANNYYTLLNSTSAKINSGIFYNSIPSDSVLSIGSLGDINSNGNTYVAYCWAEIAGYSAFGSYTGNGSTDGPFVYLGFRPRFVMIKNTSNVGNWEIQDTSRTPSNVMNAILEANTSSAEISAGRLDGLSNGFKLRTASSDLNSSGDNYIYMAFAENPFKNSLAR